MVYLMSHVTCLNNTCKIEFDYKLATIHYTTINKIIHVYFNHMTYLMSYVTLITLFLYKTSLPSLVPQVVVWKW